MAQPRIVVVGAGPAGIRAAERLVTAGVRPVVIDEAARAGGQIYRRQPANFTRTPSALYGFEAGRAVAVHRAFDALAGRIDYRPDTLVWGAFEGTLHLATKGRHEALAFDRVILATGATDRLIPVPGWTLPGVYTLGATQIALKAQATTVGRAPVFMGTGPLLYLVAYQYAKAGAKPAAVLDTSPASARRRAAPLMASRPAVLAKGMYYLARLKAWGVPIHTGVTPVAITGKGRVERVEAKAASGSQLSFAADAVGLGFGLRSETQLADLLRCELAFDEGARLWLPVTDAHGRATTTGVYIAGDGGGILGADAAELSGRLAAGALLKDLGRPVDDMEIARLLRSIEPMRRFKRGLETAFPWPAAYAASLADDTLVCRCEAITAGELRRSAEALGAREMNRAKAFVRVGMGRCQGRYCGPAAAEVLAAKLGCEVSEVGRLRGQAPVKPLEIATETVP